jgi:nucleotide-binding universal stress UspA family protein
MARLVLVPLDGSEFSESAIQPALTIAQRWDAELEILTVHESVPMMEHDPWPMAAREWIDSYVAKVAEETRGDAGVTISSTVLDGSPAEAIQNHAAARGVDLVVMATHGRGPMSRFWLGGTADGLIRQSTIPILLLRPWEGASGAQPSFGLPRKVVVPLDGSDEGEAILPHAIALAGEGETDFEILRTYPSPGTPSTSYLPHMVQANADAMEEFRCAATTYVAEKAKELVERGVSATGHVVAGTGPAAAILHFAEESGADLIAMSTHGRGGVSRLVLGSVTDKVIRGAQIPILVYHPHDV